MNDIFMRESSFRVLIYYFTVIDLFCRCILCFDIYLALSSFALGVSAGVFGRRHHGMPAAARRSVRVCRVVKSFVNTCVACCCWYKCHFFAVDIILYDYRLAFRGACAHGGASTIVLAHRRRIADGGGREATLGYCRARARVLLASVRRYSERGDRPPSSAGLGGGGPGGGADGASCARDTRVINSRSAGL